MSLLTSSAFCLLGILMSSLFSGVERMKPSEGACCLLFILLVTGWWPGASCDNPRYEKFLTQHRDDPKSSFRNRYCNVMMQRRGLTRSQCKEVNTFIHGSKRQIQAVCTSGGVPYGELRHSLQHFRVTTCTLRGGSVRPPCEYDQKNSPRFIVIACEDGWPVHYDESQIVTTV